MSTGSSPTDFAAFCDFIGNLRQSGRCDLTPEASVSEFRSYQQQLEAFHTANAEALAQSERGESKPLDVDALVKRVTHRLGVADEENGCRK